MMFSVIIPLYNKRDYVVPAVESVLAQGHDDFELLVVDDGSTDGSADLLQVEVNDPRLRIIRQENMGGAGGRARNTAMAQARGEWFAFLDADDLWLPNHLEELAAIAEHVGEPALISTGSVELPDGTAPQLDLRPQSTIRTLNYFIEAGRMIGQNNSSSSAIHRLVFERVGEFVCVPSGEDLEYWARVALEYPFATSDRITSIYYRGTMGVMEQSADERKRKPPRRQLETLADVSPSLAMIRGKAADDPSLLVREDIRAYINGRLRSGMIISLRQNVPERARALRGLMIGPLDRRAQFIALAAWLPSSIWVVLNASYSMVRRRGSAS